MVLGRAGVRVWALWRSGDLLAMEKDEEFTSDHDRSLLTEAARSAMLGRLVRAGMFPVPDARGAEGRRERGRHI